MNKIERIRAAEREYHDACYQQNELFQEGSWLYKPAASVMEIVANFNHYEELYVLDLGAGAGRHSIPIAESLLHRQGKVTAIDLLESATYKLHEYTNRFGVAEVMDIVQSSIEDFPIAVGGYDLIIAVSVIEHLQSIEALSSKLQEMAEGTRARGINCIIASTNVKELVIETGESLEPMYEINLDTEEMFQLLDERYKGWEIVKRLAKPLEYHIKRDNQVVKLSSDCITYVVRRKE